MMALVAQWVGGFTLTIAAILIITVFIVCTVDRVRG